MEKQKKIKAISNGTLYYTINGNELRQALKDVDLPKEYQWIKNKCYQTIHLHKTSLEKLNELWKNIQHEKNNSI